MKRRQAGQPGKASARAARPRLVVTNDEKTGDLSNDPPTLSRSEWIATALIAVVLLIAPIWAASFATPGKATIFSLEEIATQSYLGAALEVWTMPLVLALTAAAFCLVAWREWRRPVAIAAVPGLSIAFGLLGIWAIFSAAPNPALYLSLNALAVLFCGLLLGGLIGRLMPRSQRNRRLRIDGRACRQRHRRHGCSRVFGRAA